MKKQHSELQLLKLLNTNIGSTLHNKHLSDKEKIKLIRNNYETINSYIIDVLKEKGE